MAVASERKTIVGVFNSVQDAQDAVRDLEMEGVDRSDISIVANKNAVGYDSMEASDKAADVVADAGIGAAIGGVGGLILAAAGAVTIPVIGPVLAAGPIAAALTGAGIGAAAGGLIGALTESGIPEEEAKHYAEGVRRGDVLVTIKTKGETAERVCDVLDRHGAVDVEDRVTNWRGRGWSGYSTDAQPYSEDELRQERSYYSSDRSPSTFSGGSYDDQSSDRNRSTYGSGHEGYNDRLEQGFQSTREGAEQMRRGSDDYAGGGRSADLDRDGDVNMLERGAAGTRDTASKIGRGTENFAHGDRSADLDKDGDANMLERGASRAREAWDDMTNSPRRRSRVYDHTR